MGDSDDDGEPNTYDYNDSFIDDDDEGDTTSILKWDYGPAIMHDIVWFAIGAAITVQPCM